MPHSAGNVWWCKVALKLPGARADIPHDFSYNFFNSCRSFNAPWNNFGLSWTTLLLFVSHCKWHRRHLEILFEWPSCSDWNVPVQIRSGSNLKPHPYVVCIRFVKIKKSLWFLAVHTVKKSYWIQFGYAKNHCFYRTRILIFNYWAFCVFVLLILLHNVSGPMLALNKTKGSSGNCSTHSNSTVIKSGHYLHVPCHVQHFSSSALLH